METPPQTPEKPPAPQNNNNIINNRGPTIGDQMIGPPIPHQTYLGSIGMGMGMGQQILKQPEPVYVHPQYQPHHHPHQTQNYWIAAPAMRPAPGPPASAHFPGLQAPNLSEWYICHNAPAASELRIPTF